MCKRQKWRLVEVDFAVERLPPQNLFGRREPQAVIFIQMARVEDSQEEACDQKDKEELCGAEPLGPMAAGFRGFRRGQLISVATVKIEQ